MTEKQDWKSRIKARMDDAKAMGLELRIRVAGNWKSVERAVPVRVGEPEWVNVATGRTWQECFRAYEGFMNGLHLGRQMYRSRESFVTMTGRSSVPFCPEGTITGRIPIDGECRGKHNGAQES